MLFIADYDPCARCGADSVNLCFYRGSPYCSRKCLRADRAVILSNPDAPPPKRGRPVGAMTRNKPTYRNSGKLAKVRTFSYRVAIAHSMSVRYAKLGHQQRAVSKRTAPSPLPLGCVQGSCRAFSPKQE